MTRANTRSDVKSMNNAELDIRKQSAMARGEGAVAALYVDRASGSEMWDVEGKRYIDFATGIAVCNTGHLHPKVKAAVSAQLDRFSHTCVMVTPYESAVRLAERINDCAPGASPKKTMFVTTGAEAVENAVKIARSYTNKRGVIAFDGGYHGRTNLTMGLTGKVTPYKNKFGPFAGEIYRAPFPIEYHGVSVEHALHAIDMLFKTDIEPSDCAAILVEPVQGEGGFYPAPDEFMKALRKICDNHQIVLIADEIQTGFGRTGRMFACEHADVEPDLMTFAKGVAGGFPLAGVVGKANVMDAPEPGRLGGTYAGSPIGCSAALAVLDVIASEDLVERANVIGEIFHERLHKLKEEFPGYIGDIRAKRGAMIALEVVSNGSADEPDPVLTKKLLTNCYAAGLIVLTCGIRGNVFRFLPALTIPDNILEEGLETFCRVFSETVTKKV